MELEHADHCTSLILSNVVTKATFVPNSPNCTQMENQFNTTTKPLTSTRNVRSSTNNKTGYTAIMKL